MLAGKSPLTSTLCLHNSRYSHCKNTPPIALVPLHGEIFIDQLKDIICACHCMQQNSINVAILQQGKDTYGSVMCMCGWSSRKHSSYQGHAQNLYSACQKTTHTGPELDVCILVISAQVLTGQGKRDSKAEIPLFEENVTKLRGIDRGATCKRLQAEGICTGWHG